MEKVQLLQAMTDAYIARRRRGLEFDGIAASQTYWEFEPQMSIAQTKAFTDAGKGNGVAGWKAALREGLAFREGLPPRLTSPRHPRTSWSLARTPD